MVTKEKITVAQYLDKKYKIKLSPSELNLPLLYLQQRGEDIFLVPSRCFEASLPKDFTKDAGKMRDLRTYMITEPGHRYERISEMVEQFTKAQYLDDWKLGMNPNFA